MICSGCKYYDAEHRICRNIKARYVGSDECYKRQKKKTNADRIRSMTDEELAKFLDKVSDGCDGCPNRRKCMYEVCEDPADACAEIWLKWLKEEAEGGEHE